MSDTLVHVSRNMSKRAVQNERRTARRAKAELVLRFSN
jgi:hypothetical protein